MDRFINTFTREHPAVVTCFTDDLAAPLTTQMAQQGVQWEVWVRVGGVSRIPCSPWRISGTGWATL